MTSWKAPYIVCIVHPHYPLDCNPINIIPIFDTVNPHLIPIHLLWKTASFRRVSLNVPAFLQNLVEALANRTRSVFRGCDDGCCYIRFKGCYALIDVLVNVNYSKCVECVGVFFEKST